MQTIKAMLNKGEWLPKALKRLGYDMIPSNCILDKTLTGLGATSCEIEAKRNSIIIEPNVPVILGKLNSYDNIEAVYQKCTPYNIKAYLKLDKKYKKIMTTPESFEKIRKAAKELGINIYEEFFCLYDECEKTTQDIDYRRSITKLIHDFFAFKDKAMVSATPLDMSHTKFEEQGFTKIKIVPNYDYRKPLTLIVTNSYYKRIKQTLDGLKDSKKICIFFNVTDGIADLIDNLDITDYKVFCSEKSAKKLIKRGINNAYSEITYPLARVNFFTCRFYSALDITNYDGVKPDIIMLTDLRTANWTMIDPFTEAIQIQGRFRKRGDEEATYNSLTHISTINPDIKVRSKEEIGIKVEQFIKNHETLQKQHNNANNDMKKEAISEDLKNLKYEDLLDDKGEINPFAIDNLQNEERVHAYYKSAENLYQAYQRAGIFKVTLNNVTECVGEDDIERLNQAKLAIEQRKLIVENLANIDKWFTNGRISFEEKEKYRTLLRKIPEFQYTINAYDKIGKDAIVSAEYKKKIIDRKVREFDKSEDYQKRNSSEIKNLIKEAFPLNEYLNKNIIKQKIMDIYYQNGIMSKVTQNTIKSYFECKESGKINSFKLIKFKY